MRIKLSEKFQNEREDICNKIITILKLKEDNTFLLCDLDTDIEKQNKILEMKEDIQMNFVFRLSPLLKKRKKLDNQLILRKVKLPATRI
jgi:hypothetical protein